ncbi:sensor histidine kinase [Tunturiibacter lichenicola]|uniref:sensor histidine kinase n=1 Tax=Tunturiibacter lichenicola TaxID=2051959 RepID=UPI0021B28877|nr:sensor histidine kinase [Edaphobacter lichenicola]
MRDAQKAVIRQLAFLINLFPCCVVFTLLCVPAFPLNPDRKISQYAHNAWRMQEGFFDGEPEEIAQTTDGYLWIGTRGGLLRFDGVRFIRWIPSDGTGVAHSDISGLLGARDGSLWFGTEDSLFRWKDQKLKRISGVPGFIKEIREDREGTIWVARSGALDTVGTLCRIDGDTSQCFNESHGIPLGTEVAGSLAQDVAGNLWMGKSTLLLRLGKTSSAVYKPHGLESNNSAGINALAASPDGSMWVGVGVPGPGLGLTRLKNGVWMPFHTPELDGSKLEVTDLLYDRDGALWIGTVDQGIYRLYNGKVDRFRRTDGLSSDFVSRFFQDKEGTVWVVTPQGVDSFHDLSVATWSSREGLTADNVVSVAAAHDGTIWVGNAGGLDAIRHGQVSSIRDGRGLPGNQVRSIFEDRAKRLWVGVDNDLFVFQSGHFRKITRPEGTPIGPVKDIAEDLQNGLWVESRAEKQLVHIRDFKVDEEFQLPELPPIQALAVDSEDSLWLGLRTGDLARFENGHTETIHYPHSVKSYVRQILTNPDGSILAATSSGLLGWRDGNAVTLGVRNGLPCDGINGLILDNHGDLWLHTACGLIEILPSDLQRWWMHPETKVQFRSFDILDGVQPGNAYYQPAARSKDGRLWFANGSVLQMIDPDHLAENPIVPPVHVEEIIANQKHFSTQEVVGLPKLTKDLQIDYTALSFVSPRKVQFRYRLDGYDKDWQNPGTRRQAFYTDMAPGSYKFRVIASNNEGLWNETGASVSFFIAPAFYQTSWFYLLCLLAAGSLACIFYAMHLKRVTYRIQEQLATRLEERERIARELHDTLLQGFQGLMLRFQSVLKKIPPNASARQMMENVLDRADQVLLEGRQRVHDLREADITGEGFWDDLTGWGKELAQDYSTRFSVSIVGTPQSLDPTVCNEIYQIGREALTNAFRHALAKEIGMVLLYGHKKVRLVVRDDGTGTDVETLERGRSGHWGLSGMRERSKKIGAQLTISSHRGAGTEIELCIPARVAYRRQDKKRSYWQGLKHRLARQPEQTS